MLWSRLFRQECKDSDKYIVGYAVDDLEDQVENGKIHYEPVVHAELALIFRQRLRLFIYYIHEIRDEFSKEVDI